MGEYAKVRASGEQVKIGTCENLYYLRADQRKQVAYDFTPDVFRYRFPFPDEDQLEPGCFEDYDRGVRIPGWKLPAEFADGHYGVQFKAEPGYLLSTPCPESLEDDTLPGGLKIGRNGWHGGAMLKQQRALDGELVGIVACGSCGGKWRLSFDAAEEVAVAFRSEADREEWRRKYDAITGEFLNDYGNEPAHSSTHRAFLHELADRLLAGYKATAVAA